MEYISDSQFIYLIIGMIQGSTLTIAYVYSITRQDTWIIIITGFIVTVPLAIIYSSILKKFPGKNLIQINKQVYGRFVGNFISIIYTMYFLLIVPYNIRFVADFLNIFIFPETPMIVFIILFTFICSWAVREGIEVIARCSPILVIITFIVTFITYLLLLKNMNFSNFLPAFQLKFIDLIQGTHTMQAIPFGEILVFSMINCNLKSPKGLKKNIIVGLAISGFYILSISIRSGAVLGILSVNQVSTAYQSLELINLGNILTRLESLTTLVLIVTIFIKTCIFFYTSILSIAELLNLNSYKVLVTPISIIFIYLSAIVFDNVLEEPYVAANIYPVFTIPIQIIIPIVTLILSRRESKST
jgi:spore germination protein KB